MSWNFAEIELLGVEKRAPENDSNFKDSESIYFLVYWVTTSSGLKFKQAGAELCQAQAQDGLAATASLN